MNFIVVGCGRLGADLAYRLSKRPGSQVIVIDSNSNSFNNLPHDYQGRISEGDALNNEVLLHAGIERATALAVVTNLDATNAVIGHIARKVYHVPVVVARNYDPQCRSLFEAFGLQVISSTSWGAQRIEEMLHHAEIRSVFSAGNGEIEIYELIIPENWHGHTLGEMLNNLGIVPVSLTRAGRAFLPVQTTMLESGDILHVSSTMPDIESLREHLR